MDLTLSQEQAVSHGDGPAMVLAGPGSGKTLVIAGRVDRLIRVHHAAPSSILVITYTRAAAEEMRSRYLRSAQDPQHAVTFSTFHALFYRILRRQLHLPAGAVISDSAQAAWIREILAAIPGGPPAEGDIIREIRGEIAAVKAQGRDIASYAAHSAESAVFRQIFAAYNGRLRQERMVDFEDMGIRCEELIRNDAQVLEELREQYRYFLVDEYQDINPQQYRLLRAFAAPENNLMAVGDDDQSIYRFRGASPELMRRFAREYPQCRVYVLDRCFRCTQPVLDAAQRLVSHNRNRFSKKLRSEKGDGALPRLYLFEDPEQQDDALLQAVRGRIARGITPGNIAVLERTRFGLARLARLFDREGLPYASQEKLNGLYTERVSEDVFAYLRLAQGTYRREDLLRILNKPPRYLSRSALAPAARSPEEELEGLWRYYRGRPAQQQALRELRTGLERLRCLRPFAALEYIRHELGYERFWRESAAGELREQALEILDELSKDAALCRSFADWEALRRKNLEEAQAKERPVRPDAVRLETVHGAKGLEFDTVFLPDLNEGTLPHRKSLLEEGIEEERRLLYVALTRAKNILWLSCVRRRRAGREEPSRFLREMGIPVRKKI